MGLEMQLPCCDIHLLQLPVRRDRASPFQLHKHRLFWTFVQVSRSTLRRMVESVYSPEEQDVRDIPEQRMAFGTV